MTTLLLVRHGRTTANSSGVLAGRTAGVGLDETGRTQAVDVARRLAGLPIARVVSSPLLRCRQTATEIAGALPGGVDVVIDARLTECGYGDWTGRPLKELAKDPLWRAVQAHPASVQFPGGESIRAMQARALDAVRAHNAEVYAERGEQALWVAVSHGDVIKSIVADAVGAHLDAFQRIVVDPASVCAISYTPMRPFVLRLNEHGDLAGLAPPRRARRGRRRSSGDAEVGGGAGSDN